MLVLASIFVLLFLGACFMVLGCLVQRRICRVLVTTTCTPRTTASVVQLNVVSQHLETRSQASLEGAPVTPVLEGSRCGERVLTAGVCKHDGGG